MRLALIVAALMLPAVALAQNPDVRPSLEFRIAPQAVVENIKDAGGSGTRAAIAGSLLFRVPTSESWTAILGLSVNHERPPDLGTFSFSPYEQTRIRFDFGARWYFGKPR